VPIQQKIQKKLQLQKDNLGSFRYWKQTKVYFEVIQNENSRKFAVSIEYMLFPVKFKSSQLCFM